jgi:hypothetical protein
MTINEEGPLARLRHHVTGAIERGEAEPIVEVPSPITVTCPNCQAKPGRPCTQPTNLGRHPVSWFHTAREDAVKDESWEAE